MIPFKYEIFGFDGKISAKSEGGKYKISPSFPEEGYYVTTNNFNRRTFIKFEDAIQYCLEAEMEDLKHLHGTLRWE